MSGTLLSFTKERELRGFGTSSADRLSQLLAQTSFSARVSSFGQSSTDRNVVTTGGSCLRLLERGVLRVLAPGRPATVISEPSVLFTLKSEALAFQIEGRNPSLLCASLQFDAAGQDSLWRSLPPLLVIRLASAPELAPIAQLLFAEARSSDDGRQAALDRLAEYFFVSLLRTSLKSQLIESKGLLALNDSRLSHVIGAMQQQPEKTWSLESLARVAGMSRSRFAAHFLEAVGQTPFEYLATWRIGIAQSLLKRGEPLKMVAPAVGYSSAGALSRAFSQQVGASPVAWLSGLCAMKPSSFQATGPATIPRLHA